MENDQLNFVYDAGAVKRFHTFPTIQIQTVADHSWHVAMLAHVLYGQDAPGMRFAFMMACLAHDMAEHKVGDLPSPGKRGMDVRYRLHEVNEAVPSMSFREGWNSMEQDILSEHSFDWEDMLTEEELRRLKLVDSLEGMMFCVKEARLGNAHIEKCYDNFEKYVGELLEDVALGTDPVNDREWALFRSIRAEWKVNTYGC